MVIKKGLGKRGSAHLEIIVSFILFVSFTLFLIFTLEPTKKNLLEDSILFGVKNSFFENATTNVTYVLVDARRDSQGIICLPPQQGPCVPDELNGADRVFAKKASPSSECMYYIYVSNEFPVNPIGSCKTNDKLYTLGYIEKMEVLSNNTLQEIKTEYDSNYEASKTRLGVPGTVDFAIISNGYSLERTIPDEAEVVSGVYRKRVLYADGRIINQDFIVKVW